MILYSFNEHYRADPAIKSTGVAGVTVGELGLSGLLGLA
jgi:hypothetical protein